MSNHHFHRSAGRPAVFASRLAKPECRTTIFTGRPDRLLFFLFYYFISIRFRTEVFASRLAKPECRTTIFTGRPAGRQFLHLGLRNLNVEPPFSPVGRTVYYFACRLTFFACRAANPTRPPHPGIFQRFFCISDRLFCMSAHVFCMSSRQSYTSAAPQHFPEVFLHLGQPFLHVGSRFCMSAKRIPLSRSGAATIKLATIQAVAVDCEVETNESSLWQPNRIQQLGFQTVACRTRLLSKL